MKYITRMFLILVAIISALAFVPDPWCYLAAIILSSIAFTVTDDDE